jgi:hypothetical protein
MPGTRQLLGGGQTCRARTYHSNLLSRFPRGGQRFYPSGFESALYNLKLNMSDQHGLVVNRKRTGGFTRSGADPTGNFREVVGRMKIVTRLSPAVPVHKLIHVRYGILERTTRTVTERYSTIHAPGRLPLDLVGRKRQIRFGKIPDPLGDRTMSHILSMVFQKTFYFAH